MKKFWTGLVVLLSFLMLVACTPKNLDKAEEKMKDAGYTVEVMSGELIEITYGEYAVGCLIATKKEGSGLLNTKLYTITAILFEDKDAAKSFAEGKEGVTVDGKWVYSGDKEAIDAFTK